MPLNFRKLLVAGLVSTSAWASSACRSRGDRVDEAVEPSPPPAEAPAGSEPAKDKDKEADESDEKGGRGGGSGPKIMGYQYFLRGTFGLMQGSYSDAHENEVNGRSGTTEGVKLDGRRYIIEHYPVVYENYPRSHYG